MVMVRVEDLTKVVVGREQESLFGLRALRCIGNAVTSVTPVEPPHHRSAHRRDGSQLTQIHTE